MAAQPAFALNPIDLHEALGYVDYSTTEGRKLYYNAIAPLAEKYDGSQRGLRMFLHHVKQRSTVNGWGSTIFTIPCGTAAAPQSRNLLTQFGQVSVAQCRAFAATYLGQENKARQDSNNLKLFLAQSLGDEIMPKLLQQGNQYVVNGIEDGATMLRVLIAIVGIDTIAMVSVIRASLRALPAKMSEVNSNIVTFNEFVREKKGDLDARGETADDLVSSLYEAYQTADDEAFVRYIAHKESAIEDGSAIAADADATMNMAEDKYKIMVVKGQWNAVTKKDEAFIALQAQYDTIRKTQAAIRKGTLVPAKKENGVTGQYAWKSVAPKGKEPTTKTVEGQDYQYCPNGHKNKWVLVKGHKDGCKKDPNHPDYGKSTTFKAMATIIDHEEHESESEEENI